jgi:hypothetical protein
MTGRHGPIKILWGVKNMSYKYLDSGSVLFSKTYQEFWANDFQDLLTDQFLNASDVYLIQEESTVMSGSFVNINVRINNAVDTQTGEKLGDDYKKLLFSNITHTPIIGQKYYFSDNYWLATFTESIKSLTPSCTVRRCNNMLRWVNLSGSVCAEPCIIEYEISSPKDYGKGNLVTPEGQVKIYCQSNSNSRKIKANQRFLFGNIDNWIVYRVYGDGIRNFHNSKTTDNSSNYLLQLTCGANFELTDTDDLVNGIADAFMEIVQPTSTGSQIRVSPTISYVLESGSQIFTTRLYYNNTLTSGSFNYSISGSVPSNNYTFTSGSNYFTVTNVEKYLDSSLEVICASGSLTRMIPIELRGAW